MAKYDSCNKIQSSGYLVDLFSKQDSPRKDYQLRKDRVQNALQIGLQLLVRQYYLVLSLQVAAVK